MPTLAATRKPIKQNGANLNKPVYTHPVASAQIQTSDSITWVVWDSNLGGMLCKKCGRQRVGPARNQDGVKNYATLVGELMSRFETVHSQCGRRKEQT